MMDYQVFISYRRDTGAELAQLLYDRLSKDGYSPFFDVETMRAGRFNQQLYSVIDECNDFLLLLTKDSLERCNDENDWVRLEIEHALRAKKHIVLVIGRDFVFPNELPESIKEIRFYQGVTASTDYFDAVIDRIEKYLLSNPHSFDKKHSGNNDAVFENILLQLSDSLLDFNTITKERARLDIQRINELAKKIQDQIQLIYSFYQTNRYSTYYDPARILVDLYNKYVKEYNAIFSLSDQEKPMSSTKKAEKAFDELSDYVSYLIYMIRINWNQ